MLTYAAFIYLYIYPCIYTYIQIYIYIYIYIISICVVPIIHPIRGKQYTDAWTLSYIGNISDQGASERSTHLPIYNACDQPCQLLVQ